MVGCGAGHALHNEHTVPRDLADVTVMKWAPEPLDLHRVDAGDILIFIDTAHMIVLKATP